MAGERLEQALHRLTAWYGEKGRSLPWREQRSPYRVLVSELMLQQTRIEAVLGRFPLFLKSFPDIRSLAEAPLDEVLKAWEGLGYYSRARNLKKAAELCLEKYGGELPGSYRELKALPGLGEYTAGAVASLCFGEPVAAVDGNVLRVLARLNGDGRDVLEASVRREVREKLETVYGKGSVPAGGANEALMELGETLCLPNAQPDCGACPLGDLCLAREKGIQRELPKRSPRPERKTEEKTVLLLFCRGRLALEKRPEKGLLAGLYGFPLREGFACPEALERELQPFGLQGGLRPLGGAGHLFTHVEWRMQGFAGETLQELPGCRYVTKEELEQDCALPSAFKTYRNCLKKEWTE